MFIKCFRAYFFMLTPLKKFAKYEHFKSLDVIDKTQILLSFGMRLAMLIFFVIEIFQKRWLLATATFCFLLLTFIPALIERNYKIILPLEFEFIGVIFVFLGLVIGDMKGAYGLFAWWDTVLHFVSGIVLGIIGFTLVYLMIRYSHYSRLDPKLAFIFTFCFAMTIGAIWEIVEFGVTYSGIYKMQHGELDTMSDLIMDALGALIASILGYFYIKNEKNKFLRRILKKLTMKSRFNQR
jgi:uncharacterized membrane protein YjdF